MPFWFAWWTKWWFGVFSLILSLALSPKYLLLFANCAWHIWSCHRLFVWLLIHTHAHTHGYKRSGSLKFRAFSAYIICTLTHHHSALDLILALTFLRPPFFHLTLAFTRNELWNANLHILSNNVRYVEKFFEIGHFFSISFDRIYQDRIIVCACVWVCLFEENRVLRTNQDSLFKLRYSIYAKYHYSTTGSIQGVDPTNFNRTMNRKLSIVCALAFGNVCIFVYRITERTTLFFFYNFSIYRFFFSSLFSFL